MRWVREVWRIVRFSKLENDKKKKESGIVVLTAAVWYSWPKGCTSPAAIVDDMDKSFLPHLGSTLLTWLRTLQTDQCLRLHTQTQANTLLDPFFTSAHECSRVRGSELSASHTLYNCIESQSSFLSGQTPKTVKRHVCFRHSHENGTRIQKPLYFPPSFFSIFDLQAVVTKECVREG